MLTDDERKAAREIYGRPVTLAGVPAPPAPRFMVDVLGIEDDRTLGVSSISDREYLGQQARTVTPVPKDLNDGAVPDLVAKANAEIESRFLPGIRLQLLFVVIDGTLQAEEQRVDYRCNAHRIRVYMRSAVPRERLEFDPRESLDTGRTHRVFVLGPGGAPIVNRDMRVTHFALGQRQDHDATARYIFECDRIRQPQAPPPGFPNSGPPSEYYYGKGGKP